MKHIPNVLSVRVILTGLLLLLPFLSGIHCSTDREGGLKRFQNLSPDQKPSFDTKRVEEIFSGKDQRIGFLEVKHHKTPDQPEPTKVYHVFGPLYEAPGLGYMTEDGKVYRKYEDKSSQYLGRFGFHEGIKKLLDHEGTLNFYRFGKQVFH